MFNASITGMFVYKDVTSNDTIISSSFHVFTMYLLRLFNGEPFHETIGRIGTPAFCFFA